MIDPRLFTEHAYPLPDKEFDLEQCVLLMLDKNTSQVYQLKLSDLKSLLIDEFDDVGDDRKHLPPANPTRTIRKS